MITPLQGAVKSALLNAAGDVEDAQTIQGLAVAGFKFNPMLAIEAGFGYMYGKNTSAAGVGTLNADLKQTAMLYDIQAPIGLAPGVSITPEIGRLDLGDLETDIPGVSIPDQDLGTLTYYMAKFQIDF